MVFITNIRYKEQIIINISGLFKFSIVKFSDKTKNMQNVKATITTCPKVVFSIY